MHTPVETSTTRTRNESPRKNTRGRRLALRILQGGAIAGALAAFITTGPASAAPLVACGNGMVCIYPQTGFRGIPYVHRASEGNVGSLPARINDKTFSVRNNSNRVARIYQHSGFSGPRVCVQSGGSISDLRSFPVSRNGSSLKINADQCG